MKTATRFAELRRAKGLTQQQLAEALGVSVVTVYRWEREGLQPKASMLPLLARVLGVSVEELLGIKAAALSSQVASINNIGNDSSNIGNVTVNANQELLPEVHDTNTDKLNKIAPSWSDALNLAYKTAEYGEPQGIDVALDIARVMVKVLEHAQAAAV